MPSRCGTPHPDQCTFGSHIRLVIAIAQSPFVHRVWVEGRVWDGCREDGHGRRPARQLADTVDTDSDVGRTEGGTPLRLLGYTYGINKSSP
eukprot:6649396-Prymnesium_polylepis.1